MIGKLSRHVTLRCRDKAGARPGREGDAHAFKASVSAEVMNPLIPVFSKVTRWFHGLHEMDRYVPSLMWKRL